MTADVNNDLANADPRVVTVWSDVGCPWAMLALHTLHAAARELGRDLLVDHRAFPLELFNRQPTPKTLVEAELVAIGGNVPELGLQLWNAADFTYPVTTLPALEAIQAAKDPAVGGLRASDELDTALREAYLVESRCISVHSVILDVAKRCDHVNENALADAMARGAGRAEIYRQWHTAQGPEISGSPHLFASGFVAHNPGVTYRWTAPPPIGFPWPGKHGFPVLEHYDRSWATELLGQVPGCASQTAAAVVNPEK